MRNLVRGPQLWLAALFMLNLSLFTACKSPEQAAYKATGTVIITVDAAMNAWGDYVRKGLATPDDQAKVKAIYDKYYLAVQVERDAVISYKQNHDTNTLNRVLGAVEASSADVVALIEKLLPLSSVANLKGGS